MCAGDFNEILEESEKFGGCRKARGLMEAFKEALDVCNLSDLGASGLRYTWHNGQEGDSFIQERLDRVVASPDWCENFSRSSS
jgi:hypothetical protein